jgi:hypothetical protein
MDKIVCGSATKQITPRQQLSRAEFEQICFEAAKGYAGCAGYISIVLANLCSFLCTPETLRSLSTKTETDLANAQAAVVSLYFLLEQKCEYDFDVAEVLNSYEADSVRN